MPPARLVLLLAAAALAAIAPAAAQPPFHVNAYTPDVQGNPAVAGRADGSFVVVWESNGQDGDYLGVFGRRLAADGLPLGPEQQVSTYVFGRQASPAVAAAASGAFMVVWEGYGEGGDFGDVFARRLDADGQPLGSEFQVNEPVPAYETAPAIAAQSDGGFIVVWDDYNDVFGRRFDSAGAPRGGQFQINPDTSGTQQTATVATTADGGFVVAWADGAYLGDGRDGYGYGVFARRYDSSGAALGSEFQINTSTLGDQYGPAVAATTGGGFVVVWQSYDTGNQAAIFGRRFDSGGLPDGSEFQISTATADLVGAPAVSAAAAGGFAVVWASAPRDASGGSVALLRRFDAAGTPLGAALPVDADATADEFEPAVSALDDHFVVVWRDDRADGADAGVLGAIVSATPPTPGPSRTATATPTPTPSCACTATVTMSATPTDTAQLGATPTATATPSPPTPSASTTPPVTETPPTQTPPPSETPPPTVTVPLPTATSTRAPICAGDCNGNGSVTVDDLILAVNIALGSQPASRCMAADGNGDGDVTVAELITAVNRALGGCPS